jgi:nitrite reductase/ring-hydroxylating ferredoxin subunit
MTRRRVSEFVDALLANRRPAPFAADADDAQAMRAAIELRAGQPGASLPRPEFVAELHRQLSADLVDPAAEPAATAPTHVSRRGLLAGAAAAAAAAVAGAFIDHELVGSPGPTPAAGRDLVPDQATWRPVAASSDVANGQVVRFMTKQAVGFVSTTGDQLRAVSGACTHQGCLLALNQVAGKLDCPCHRASFALSGDVLNHELPIALAPLPRLQVRDRNGHVEVLLPPET